MPQLSVVIPVINEADAISALLSQLGQQQHIQLQIIVVDGGSTDATCEVVASFPDVVLVSSAAGRGVQMNAGRRVATADYLLFLHADTQLLAKHQLAEAYAYLQAEEQRGGQHWVAGHFALQFHDESGRQLTSRRYQYLSCKTHLNRQNTTNGDQGMLCAAQTFDALGGFDERWGFLEDQTFAERLRENPKGRWVTLPSSLSTAARRFEVEGFAARYLLMSLMMALYMIGFHRFFDAAPDVYRQQTQSKRLLMTPFFRLTTRLLSRHTWLYRFRLWCSAGRYIASNGWQAWLLPQMWLGRDAQCARASLRHYDRWVRPIVMLPIWWPLLGLLLWLWGFVVLRLYYRWIERHDLIR